VTEAERKQLGVLASLGDKLIGVLPPAFLLLLILNIVFMGSVIYVVQHNAEARNIMLSKILDKCLDKGS
jgi:hypothetical protein